MKRLILFVVCLSLVSTVIYSLPKLWNKPDVLDDLKNPKKKEILSRVKVIDVSGEDKKKDILEMAAAGLIQAPPDFVWEILTDYDNYKKYFPAVTQSQYDTNAKTFLVHVVIDAIFKKYNFVTILKLTEIKEKDRFQIKWEVINGGMFKGMTGYFDMERDKGNTLFSFEGISQPGDFFLFKKLNYVVEQVMIINGKKLRSIIEKKYQDKKRDNLEKKPKG